jgi:hypothetical protein
LKAISEYYNLPEKHELAITDWKFSEVEDYRQAIANSIRGFGIEQSKSVYKWINAESVYSQNKK